MSIERLLKAYELEKQILPRKFWGKREQTCPISAIKQAEKRLGLFFPPTYRYYLRHIHLNTLTPIFGVEVTSRGTFKDPSSVFATFDLRESEDLPETYVLIDRENDFQHVINSSQVNDTGESPVYAWRNGEEEVVYSDFDGFYLELVNVAIYLEMMRKASFTKEGLRKKELDEYIDLHKSLGFTAKEQVSLQGNWDQLRSLAK